MFGNVDNADFGKFQNVGNADFGQRKISTEKTKKKKHKK